nr:MAG TPA: Receptor Binding Protein [Caudoviricetes sp.]
MTKRVFNMGGGAHSDAAYTAFENAAYGSCVANATSLAVSAGGGMSVRIAAGDGIISTPSSGKRIQSDAIETVTISAANATYSRIDSVVVYIDSAVQPTTAVIDNVNGILKFAAVAGTPAANPTAPTESMIQAAIGAGNRYMVLADVKVPNGATSTNTATFTDRRKIATMVDSSNLAKKAVKAENIDFTTMLTYGVNNSAQTISGSLVIQSGWVSFFGNSTKQQSVQVTFPKKFKEVYAVIPTLIGYTFKTPTAPADFTQIIGAGTNIECGAFNQTGTTITASTSGIFGGANHGISWIAIGTI